MLYLYAIARAGLDAEGIHGLEDQPVESIGGPTLVALATRHDGLELRPTEKFVWAHQGVVERLAERGDLLPLRIATTLDGAGSVLEMLRAREPEFHRALERVRGAVEFGVRAVTEDSAEPARTVAAPTSGGPGTAYMLDRLARRRSREALRREVLEPLSSLARASSLRPTRTGADGETLSVAYLVDRGAAEQFSERVAELDDELDTTRVLCTGPWPPYSFVDPPESS